MNVNNAFQMPYAVQPKIDGMRAFVYLDKE